MKILNNIMDKLLLIIKICNKVLLLIKYVIPFFILLLTFFIIAQWLGYDLSSTGFSDISETGLFLALYVVLWIFVNILLKFLSKSLDLRNEYREYLVRELENDVLEKSSEDKAEGNESKDDDREDKTINNIIIEQRKNDKKDIIALMLKNNDEITEYFKISKSQAKSSFWFSVISCIVGLMALVVGIYGIVILKDVSVSVISLISGSISELISGTIFWVHNKSALQLNHYYDALHENEKFLSAVNIADKLSAEKREDVLVEIIHKQINYESSKIKIEDTKEKEKKKEEDKDS